MSSEKIKCDEQKLYDNTYITQGQLNKLKRGKMSSEKKKCRFCKDKTTDYKKINKTKVFLCCKNCEINYVLKRFLHKNYKYDNVQGNVSFILPSIGGRPKQLKGWF